jgi:hypothetical protein
MGRNLCWWLNGSCLLSCRYYERTISLLKCQVCLSLLTKSNDVVRILKNVCIVSSSDLTVYVLTRRRTRQSQNTLTRRSQLTAVLHTQASNKLLSADAEKFVTDRPEPSQLQEAESWTVYSRKRKWPAPAQSRAPTYRPTTPLKACIQPRNKMLHFRTKISTTMMTYYVQKFNTLIWSLIYAYK